MKERKGRVMIIGAGAVATVTTHKCAQLPQHFKEIMVASRTLSKCAELRNTVRERYGRDISIAQVDANDVSALVSLINGFKPDLVINLALPYQDLAIMEACLQAGVDYIDTANYESEERPQFEYKLQWAYREKYAHRGIMAVLGCGFDPGVTNAYAAYALKHIFDEINYLDILDCNAGKHGHPFATNFNPEVNIREVTQPGRYWQEGQWITTPPIIDENSLHFAFPFPLVGPREVYLIYHEELESLVTHLKGLKRARFWMTFSDNYLTHLRVLHNVGLTRIDEVEYEGHKIVPLRFLKAVLPDPTSLGKNYEGKTVIGNVMTGKKEGKTLTRYIYNICDHRAAYEETGTQAVAFTAGVPAMIGALMLMTGAWQGKGVFNVEELDPDPFMEALNKYGLPWEIKECDPLPDKV
ncbi:MAG TPA: saccharopine dehydrogenase family protein [Syntrophales bacterium]|nr:saccharopine dehydrogenase family protein [Syntrophales bacterium]HOL59206.1 saccharopine dehydrogenase family protein [Syntrophales bacterium]HPO35713.1 saccharopine dehydrogenase family protein [Syntrophales bacterium]